VCCVHRRPADSAALQRPVLLVSAGADGDRRVAARRAATRARIEAAEREYAAGIAYEWAECLCGHPRRTHVVDAATDGTALTGPCSVCAVPDWDAFHTPFPCRDGFIWMFSPDPDDPEIWHSVYRTDTLTQTMRSNEKETLDE